MSQVNDQELSSALKVVEQGYQYLADKFAIGEPAKEFQLLEFRKDELGMTHLRLQQVNHGLKVFNQHLIVHFAKDGSLRDITGDYRANLGALEASPKLAPARAIELAQQSSSDQPEQHCERKPQVELGIYPKAESNYLAYAVLLPVWHDNRPVCLRVYVDANTGEILDQHYDLNVTGATRPESELVQAINRRLADQ